MPRKVSRFCTFTHQARCVRRLLLWLAIAVLLTLNGVGGAYATTTTDATDLQPFTSPALSIWGTAVPGFGTTTNDDPHPVEVGIKFRANIPVFIAGIRFYKGSGNTGMHIGSLWNSAGMRMASATFTDETETGWQEVLFAEPIPIAANTTYVASYFAPNGGYSYEPGYFASAYESGPLHALKDGEDGGNGVYTYWSSSTFPMETFNSTNYFVDVLFTTASPPLASFTYHHGQQ